MKFLFNQLREITENFIPDTNERDLIEVYKDIIIEIKKDNFKITQEIKENINNMFLLIFENKTN